MKAKAFFTKMGQRAKGWLARLSFRTGVIVLAACVPFYVISFAQLALPIGASLKGVLWVVFFGLAKAAQYGGLTILGAEGIRRMKACWQRKGQAGWRLPPPSDKDLK